MFCRKCGTQLKENAKFCAVCGTAVNIEAQPVQQADPFAQSQSVQQADPFAQSQPVQQADPFAQSQPVQQWSPTMKPKKNSKAPLLIGIIGGALALVIVLVVVLLFACSGGKGADTAQEAVSAYFEALNNKDFGDLEDIMYPTVFEQEYDEDLYEKDEFVEVVIEQTGPVSNADDKEKVAFGSVSVTDKENSSASVVKSYNSTLKGQDGYVKIEKAAELTGKVVIKVDGEKATYKFSATVVMADGSWYVANISVRSYPMDED